MLPAKPEAGLVVRYAFLWKQEAARKQEEGAKDRPVVVIVLLAEGDEVVVAPITTKQPAEGEPAIEMPARVRRHLGLDAGRSWISVATLNRFVWPGPDLRPIPSRSPATVVYGHIPQLLLDALKRLTMTELAKRVPGLVVRRTGE
jgi:hypothetical protein